MHFLHAAFAKSVFAHAKNSGELCVYGSGERGGRAYLGSRGGHVFQRNKEIIMANSKAGRGFFRSAMDAIVEARTRQADRYVNSALLMLDDATLRAHGHNPDELRKRGGHGGYMF
jgi:hypothetical protein